MVIHVSDPVAFHTPVDRYNEHYEELGAHPDWSFYGNEFPYSKDEILEQLYRVIAKHPNTIFVSTHMGNLAEDLGRVAGWLEQYPSMYVDIDARISELGRQPFTARKFMIKYQDRIFLEQIPLRILRLIRFTIDFWRPMMNILIQLKVTTFRGDG